MTFMSEKLLGELGSGLWWASAFLLRIRRGARIEGIRKGDGGKLGIQVG
jgi:hypothetical protein